MPKLTFEINKISNDYYPIALVKSFNKNNRKNNKLIYIDVENKGRTNINLNDDEIFEIIPTINKDKRDIFYICGASGSGKSYIAKTISENYNKMFEDRPIYLISKLEFDETIDQIKGLIRLDYKNLQDININEFSNSLVIFDDYDTIEKPYIDHVELLINDIAIMGRKHHEEQGNISMLLLSHYLTNYKKTRLILNEANFIIVYPNATSYNALYYLLNTYIGMNKEDIKNMKKLNSRWVCIHKNYPQYYISLRKIQLLNVDEDEDEEFKSEDKDDYFDDYEIIKVNTRKQTKKRQRK